MAPRRPRNTRSGPAYPLTLINLIQQVACYGRVSSDLQRDTETIKIQVTKLEGTIRVRMDPELPDRDRLNLVGSYWDDGISGTIPLEQRPEGRKLVEAICPRASIDCDGRCQHTGQINQVWITKLDRLARKLQILIDIEAFLRRHDVSLMCMDPTIDTSTPTGRLVFTVLAAIADWERETILERTSSGKHQKASEGKWVGGRKTFGLKTDEDGHLIIDETFVEQAGEMAYRVVQSIFDNVALHESTTWKEAQRTGLTERRVNWILHNPRYKGEGGIYDADGNWTAATKNPPPQLVSPEKWEMAQAQLVKNRARSGGRPHQTYLLSGLLTCCEPYVYISTVDDEGRTRSRPSNQVEGVCGRSFSGRKAYDVNSKRGRSYVYYFCTRTLKNRPGIGPGDMAGCTAKMVRAADAEGAVWDLVKRFVSNPGEMLAEADSGREDLLKQLNTELGQLVQRLSNVEAERGRVMVSFESGWRTQASTTSRLDELAALAVTLEQQRDATEMQIRSLSHDRLDTVRCRTTIAELTSALEEIDRDNNLPLKKALIQAVVKRIEVRTVDNRPRLRIMMRFGGDQNLLLTDLRSSQLLTARSHESGQEVMVEVRLLDGGGWKAVAA